MSNPNTNSEDYDPYEISDADYEAMRFNQSAPPVYSGDRRGDDRYQSVQLDPYIPPPADTTGIPQPNNPPPPYVQSGPNQPVVPSTPNTPPPEGDPFSSFNPDAYLQRQQEGTSGYVNPDSAVPLQGFDIQVPARQQSIESPARIARTRSLTERRNFSIMRDGEPLIRIGTILFFLVAGVLVSICWISNIVLLVWYMRR